MATGLRKGPEKKLSLPPGNYFIKATGPVNVVWLAAGERELVGMADHGISGKCFLAGGDYEVQCPAECEWSISNCRLSPDHVTHHDNADPVPHESTLQGTRPLTLREQMALMLREELGRMQVEDDVEDFNEADDFDVDDDFDYDPMSPYQVREMENEDTPDLDLGPPGPGEDPPAGPPVEPKAPPSDPPPVED